MQGKSQGHPIVVISQTTIYYIKGTRTYRHVLQTLLNQADVMRVLALPYVFHHNGCPLEASDLSFSYINTFQFVILLYGCVCFPVCQLLLL